MKSISLTLCPSKIINLPRKNLKLKQKTTHFLIKALNLTLRQKPSHCDDNYLKCHDKMSNIEMKKSRVMTINLHNKFHKTCFNFSNEYLNVQQQKT